MSVFCLLFHARRAWEEPAVILVDSEPYPLLPWIRGMYRQVQDWAPR